MELSEAVVVRSRPTSLLVISLVIALLAVGAPLWFAAFGPGVRLDNVLMVWTITAALVAGLWCYAAYESSRTLRLQEARVQLTGWFGSTEIDLTQLAGVSLRWEDPFFNWVERPVLVFWGRNDQTLGTFDLYYADRSTLRLFVQRLLTECPSLTVERDARAYLERGT